MEIGPGLGALTQFLLHTKQVIAVEISSKLFHFLNTSFRNYKNVIFYNCDILKFDFRNLRSDIKYKVVGNLPYVLATKILKMFLPKNDLFDYLYFSFPQEIATKITALKNTKCNSALSIFVSLFSVVKPILTINADNFYPQPKVKSVFLAFKLRQYSLFTDKNQQTLFLQFVHHCFFYKRKTLVNNLRERYNLSSEQLDLLKNFLLEVHDSLLLRAESLNLTDFLLLFQKFFRQVIKSKS